MPRHRASGGLLALTIALGVASGCTTEHDRISAAFKSDWADSLAGCVPIAWERNPGLPIVHGQCGTGRYQNNLAYILDVLSHTGRARLAAEKPGPRQYTYAKQYELVESLAIARSTTKAGTTSLLCWAGARAHIVDTGPMEIRAWRLSVNVWIETETTPRPWAARLRARDRKTLRRHSFGSRYVMSLREQTSWWRPRGVVRTATYRDGDRPEPGALAHRDLGHITTPNRMGSPERICWPCPQYPGRGTRSPTSDLANGFGEGDLSAWTVGAP